MRILIVTDNFPPRHFGGMAQHAWHIACHLSERHTVCVLIPRAGRADWGRVPFHILPWLSLRFPSLDRLAIRWVAGAFPPDVVHVCTAALSYTWLVRHFPSVARTVGNDFLRAWCGYGLPMRAMLCRLPSKNIKARVRAVETRIRSRKTIARLKEVRFVAANSEWTRVRLIERRAQEKRISVIV